MNTNRIIGIAASVAIQAKESGPPQFSSVIYTGGMVVVAHYDLPLVVDLDGLTTGNVLVANLDHDSTKRVGNFEVENDGEQLIAHGTVTAATPWAAEVVQSYRNGYTWQASIEVLPTEIEEIPSGKSVHVNGRKFEGPIYVTRKGVLKGFAFVSHGADDNTSVAIAASIAEFIRPEQRNTPRFFCSDMLDDKSNWDEIEAEFAAGRIERWCVDELGRKWFRRLDADGVMPNELLDELYLAE